MRLPSLLATCLFALLVLVGCGGDEQSTDDADGGATTTADDASGRPDETSSGDLADADLGTGWVMVDNDRFELSGGTCQLSRFDGEAITDLSDDAVAVVIGVDNVADGAAAEGEEIAMEADSSRLELRGAVSGAGEVSSMTEAGPGTEIREGARINEIGIIAELDDGRPVTASVVCILET